MDGLGTVYLERIRIKSKFYADSFALLLYCKIEFGALSKDSITEKNSVIVADGKNYQTMLYNHDDRIPFSVSGESLQTS